jgi:hypothetical protein
MNDTISISRMLATAASLLLTMVGAGSTHAQGAPAACVLDGAAIMPATTAPNEYAWAFLANFDHAPSSANTIACLAERMGTGPTTYTVLTCPLQNNVNGAQVGGGSGAFDGSLYATCAVSTAMATSGPPFGMGARASYPAAGVVNTLVSSPDIAFRAQRSAGCQLTLNSVYDGWSMTHTSPAVACTAMHKTNSRLVTGTPAKGQHRVNGNLIGQVNLPAGPIVYVPASFSLQLGTAGSVFGADYIWVDPKGGHCCGGG